MRFVVGLVMILVGITFGRQWRVISDRIESDSRASWAAMGVMLSGSVTAVAGLALLSSQR